MSKMYFRYSSMNAGKTTALLQVAHNYESLGQSVLVFTAKIDDRYGVGKVTSRLGVGRDAAVFDESTSFVKEILLREEALPACVLVDEAQFLTEGQVRSLHEIAACHGVPVICYGLRTDFQGNPFPGASALLALADALEELRTVCKCGKKASFNMRIDAEGRRVTEGQSVEIGGNDRYVAVCPRCFYAHR